MDSSQREDSTEAFKYMTAGEFVTIREDGRRACRAVKIEFMFYKRNSQLSRSVQYVNVSKKVLRLKMQ